jgi:hypothetical protein
MDPAGRKIAAFISDLSLCRRFLVRDRRVDRGKRFVFVATALLCCYGFSAMGRPKNKT